MINTSFELNNLNKSEVAVKNAKAFNEVVEICSALFAGKDIEFAFHYAVAAIGVFNLPGTDIPVIYKNGSKVI